MPRRRAAGEALAPSDEALLQGQWDAGAFGIAEVRGSRVFYPTLKQEFVLRIQDRSSTSALPRCFLLADGLLRTRS